MLLVLATLQLLAVMAFFRWFLELPRPSSYVAGILTSW